MATSLEHHFRTRTELFNDLSEDIRLSLTQWSDTHEPCFLILPGGNTPRPLYEKLADISLPWSKIRMTLSDERWLERSETNSNEYQLRAHLLDKFDRAVNFISWKNDHASVADALATLTQEFSSLKPKYCYAILGMGDDGHFASLFPKCQTSQRALNGEIQSQVVIETEAPKPPHKRLSFEFSHICQWQKVVILITGEAKKRLIQQCQNSRPTDPYYNLPISHLIRQSAHPVNIYWSP